MCESKANGGRRCRGRLVRATAAAGQPQGGQPSGSPGVQPSASGSPGVLEQVRAAAVRTARAIRTAVVSIQAGRPVTGAEARMMSISVPGRDDITLQVADRRKLLVLLVDVPPEQLRWVEGDMLHGSPDHRRAAHLIGELRALRGDFARHDGPPVPADRRLHA